MRNHSLKIQINFRKTSKHVENPKEFTSKKDYQQSFVLNHLLKTEFSFNLSVNKDLPTAKATAAFMKTGNLAMQLHTYCTKHK